ncbi:hypothetical protein GSI_06209 [Ganoderma sinense ZZ0214-1]|uniref:Uncharacterized protein n=1 Tax=Ganoderma sinense ZZ0214-1 TaxID=1077348 RepID=A0A2G8SCP2_9APHY|nr:hypothetical protein GSI_06209 [Ganoderma sinense ZZ0214-1]
MAEASADRNLRWVGRQAQDAGGSQALWGWAGTGCPVAVYLLTASNLASTPTNLPAPLLSVDDMLSRLSRAASRTLASTIEVGGGGRCSQAEDDKEVLSLNVDELCQLAWPLPQFAWNRVSDICTRTVTPVYNVLSSTLHDDVEQLAQLFVDMEVATTVDRDIKYFEPVARDVLPTSLKRCQGTTDLTALPRLPSPPRARRRSFTHDTSLVISNCDPSIPTIVVTPCPSLPREDACLIPYQDAAFGNRLPVPTHPVLNDVFPPLMAKPFPLVERWRYEDGHWQAQLPPVQEQMSKGMFSRPLSTRRQKTAERTHPSRGRTCYSRSSHREG